MARKSKSRRDLLLTLLGFVALLPFLVAQWIHETLGIPVPITLTVVVGLVACIVVAYLRRRHQKFRAIQIANVDAMSGEDFERYLQRLLSARGYGVHHTRVTGDLGVDLVASHDGTKIAIQVKRHENRVSRRAVSDAVAGMQYYRCNQAMVITNNYFTEGAMTLARSTGCVLIDRDELSRWILDLQNDTQRADTQTVRA